MGARREDPDTYEINGELIQMIAESPLNGFLAFVGNADGATNSTGGEEEVKESAPSGSSAEVGGGED